MIRSETAPLRRPPDLRQALREHQPSAGTWVLAAVFVVALAVVFIDALVLGSQPAPMISTLVVGALALLGALLGVVTSRRLVHPRVIDLVAAGVGGGITQFMAREMGMHLVIAGAAAGALIGLATLPGALPIDARAAGAAYTGVVAGLVTPNVVLPEVVIILAAVVAGAIFSMMAPSVLPGVGARMGTAGFIGGSIVYLAADVAGAERPALIPPPSTGVPHWGIVPVAVAGALVTWALVNRGGVPFILTSGVTTLLMAGPAIAYLPGDVGTVLAVAWFGGTFVGGSGGNRLPTAFWITVAALLYGSLMLHFEGPLDGHAGIIGAVASIACLAAAGIEWIVQSHHIAPHIDRIAERGSPPPE